MKNKISIFCFCLFAVLLVSVTLLPKKQTGAILLMTQQKTFVAGAKIALDFKVNSSNRPQLFLIHSLGKTLLDATVKNDKLTFALFKRKIYLTCIKLAIASGEIFGLAPSSCATSAPNAQAKLMAF